MTPFSAVVGGGFAGFLGAALAHVLTTWAGRHGTQAWLRGPYGPPFFNVALYTGVFYAAIAAAAGRRAGTALLGFLGAFLGVLFPMLALTRHANWDAPQWQLAVLVVYVAAVWGTIAAIGAAAAGTKAWRGAPAAVLGSLAGYAVLGILLKLLPDYTKTPWNPLSLIPSPLNLMDGLLSGAGLCLALSLDELYSKRIS